MNEENNRMYLRPKKKIALRHVEESLKDMTGKLSVRVFENSVIQPRGQIVNIQETKNPQTIIDDIDYCCDIVAVETVEDEATVLYGGYYRHQWGHFLLNTTARLWWLFENKENPDSIDKIVFISTPGESDKIDGNYKEFFQLSGIYDKIEIISSPKSYAKIIVPDISFEHDRFYAKEMNKVFEKIKSNSETGVGLGIKTTGKKIFLTRTQLQGAENKEFNLGYFDQLWADNGFEVIAPEKVSLKELVMILNGAETIVSVSGSTAHNLMFASSRSSVVIMERVATINDFQVGISKLKGQDVTYIDCFLYPLIPVATGNVFYYFPTRFFNDFIRDRELKYFDNNDLERIKSIRNVFRFFSSYEKQSGRFIGLSGNGYDLESIEEAYSETAGIYGEAMKSKSLTKLKIKKLIRRLKKILKK